MTEQIQIPARSGKAVFMRRGQTVRVINTHGQQVVDTWAFNRADMREAMSMEHSRASIGRILPHVDDAMCTNHRRPILTILADDSGGIHDTLIAACDRYRYELLGHAGHHANCTDNLAACLAALDAAAHVTPAPWNLFMNIPVAADGSLAFLPPISRPGSSITLRAEMDIVIAFSACPQDLIPINGAACIPMEAHFELH